MKIAVTGANGFVGSAVLAALAARDIDALPLVRRANGLAGERVTGDLADGALTAGDLEGVDAIMHLAARTHVTDDRAADPLAEYRRTNVEGTQRLLEAAKGAGVRRIAFMSSVKAAGERSQPGRPLTPESPPRPEDHYGTSKLEAEKLVREYCSAHDMEWSILRPPLVYGPGVRANFERLVKLVASGVPLPFGAIDNRRSLVEVRNLAEAAVLAAIRPEANGRLFIVSDATLSTPELIRKIAQAMGRPARLVPFPPAIFRFAGKVIGRTGMVDRLCGSLELDPSDTVDVLGWSAHISLEESLAQLARELGYSSDAAATGSK